MGNFWKGAFGTKKQKLFWIIFSIIVAIIVAAIIFALLPHVGHCETRLYAGEWAHIYPDSFWHESAQYQFTTVTKDGKKGDKVKDNADAFVYDMGLYGKDLDFDMKADRVDLLIGKAVPQQNWNASLYMTFRSSISVTVDPTYVPMDFIATTDESVQQKFLEDGSVKDKSVVLEHVQKAQQLSATVEIEGVNKYLYSQRVYVGLIVTAGDNRVVQGDMMYYRHVARVPEENSTYFNLGQATMPFNSLSVLQITAPEVCTSETVKECILEVTLQPRWPLFFGVVVAPAIIVGVGVTIALMALKAWHVQLMIAEMRKKANEEGVALEEGKSKDIHAEKLKEGESEGEAEHPEGEQHEEEHPDEEHPEGEKAEEEKKPEEESTDGAILTTGSEATD